MSYLKVKDDVLRQSLIQDFNEETKSKIILSTDRDKSVIDDAIIQDFDETSQVYQIEQIEEIQQQRQEQLDQLKKQQQQLGQKKSQIEEEIKSIINEKNKLHKQWEENQTKSNQDSVVMKQKIDQLELQYKGMLENFEEFSKNESINQLNQIYDEFRQLNKEATLISANNEMDREQEQALQNEIAELNREYNEIEEIFSDKNTQQQFKNLQDLMLQNDTFQSMEEQLHQKQQKLIEYYESNQELEEQEQKLREKVDNLFIKFNNNRREIKQLKEQNSQIRLQGLQKQQVSVSRSPSKIAKVYLRKTRVCVSFSGFLFLFLLIVFILRGWYDYFQDNNNL